MLLGAHVSIAGGVDKAPAQAAEFGCEVFQIFSRPPQSGKSPAINPVAVERLQSEMKRLDLLEFYVHAPYIVNFASPMKNIRENTVRIITDEMERASTLGARYMMTHLGSTRGEDSDLAKKAVVEGLKKVMEKEYTTELLMEISAGAGDVVGDTFEELAYFLDELKGYKIGICLDTAHMFASGYDLRDAASVKKTFDAFDAIVGFEYLRMFHLNDSKVGLGEKKDRHEHFGDGYIGLEGFKAIAAESRLQQYNFICETEHDKVADDIALMKKLRAKQG